MYTCIYHVVPYIGVLVSITIHLYCLNTVPNRPFYLSETSKIFDRQVNLPFGLSTFYMYKNLIQSEYGKDRLCIWLRTSANLSFNFYLDSSYNRIGTDVL